MNSHCPSRLILAALLIGGIATRANANLFSDNFDMLVVAQRAKDAPKDSDTASSYVAFDGGYVEAGDPIAGDTPPTADQVRQSLDTALAQQGFRSGPTVPSLVITYHWGVLRVDHLEIKVPFEIRKNWSARVALVSTDAMYAEIENHAIERARGSGGFQDAASPVFLTAPLDAAVERARLPRIFVVVSAYDYDSLFRRHQAKLVWRTKLSAQETSGDMAQVIPSLVSKGTPYFGRDMADVIQLKATLAGSPSAATAVSYPVPQQPEFYHLDVKVLEGLFRQEQLELTACEKSG